MSSSAYTRKGYFALKQESTAGTAVIPDVYMALINESISAPRGPVPSMRVNTKRQKNIEPIEQPLGAPTGSIVVECEPTTAGYVLKGAYGTVYNGEIVYINTLSADFTIGETVTGGTSSETATVVYTSSEGDYVLVSSSSGNFTVGETITGGTSSSTAVVVTHDQSRYGHQFTENQSDLPTWTMDIAADTRVRRLAGARIIGINAVKQVDNRIQIDMQVSALSEFLLAKVTAVTTSGAGSKVISVDQTLGLVASDSVKIFRPSTGAYIDFASAGVKTHTINSFVAETSITVTNLETATAVGDILEIAPATPSYSLDKPFTWIGGADLWIADTITAALSASSACIEDFEIMLMNSEEYKHCANGYNRADRFPSTHHLMGLEASGKLTKTYESAALISKLVLNELQAVMVKFQGTEIGSTGLYHTLDFRIPAARWDDFDNNIEEDALMVQEIPFTNYDSEADGFFHKALLVNDTASY